MSIGIHVGNFETKKSKKHFVSNLIRLMQAGYECSMDGKTIRHVMSCFTNVTDVKNVTVSNCQLTVEDKLDVDK